MLKPTNSGTAPVRAWGVEMPSGGLGVEWGDEYRPASKEPVLHGFLALADAEGEELAPAVASFVQKFGSLGLCRAHGRYWADRCHNGPELCTPTLRPEPLEEWQYWAQIARHGWALKTAARWAGRMGKPASEALERIYSNRGWSRPSAVYAVEREGRGMPDPQGEHWARAHTLGSVLHLLEETPEEPSEVWKVLDAFLGYGLGAFPCRVESRPTPDGIRLHLQPAGVLGRLFLELAQELGGSGSVAWCDECGEPHARERAPKRGQGCYCSGRCRKRAHARRNRAG